MITFAGIVIVAAFILACWAVHHAERALRGAIYTYFMTVPDARWTPSFWLQRVFGSSVYPHLRVLVQMGLLESQTTAGNSYLYRRKGADAK